MEKQVDLCSSWLHEPTCHIFHSFTMLSYYVFSYCVSEHTMVGLQRRMAHCLHSSPDSFKQYFVLSIACQDLPKLFQDPGIPSGVRGRETRCLL